MTENRPENVGRPDALPEVAEPGRVPVTGQASPPADVASAALRRRVAREMFPDAKTPEEVAEAEEKAEAALAAVRAFQNRNGTDA